MGKIVKAASKWAYHRTESVFVIVCIAILLGVIIAKWQAVNIHQLGIAAGAVWFCGAIYLRLVNPYRDLISGGVSGFFALITICIIGSTGFLFLPNMWGRSIQAGAYIAFGFAAIVALMIIVHSVSQNQDAYRQITQ